MVRRTAILGVVALVVTAGQAFAATTWHTQMKDGTATASRSASKCTFAAGSQSGTLRVVCSKGGKARLHYVFTSSNTVMGTPSSSVDDTETGSAVAIPTATASGKKLQVTVTISGAGSVVVSSVSVGYYTK